MSKRVRVPEGQAEHPYRAIYAASVMVAVSDAENTVRLLDVDTKQILRTIPLPKPPQTVYAAAYSHATGRLVLLLSGSGLVAYNILSSSFAWKQTLPSIMRDLQVNLLLWQRDWIVLPCPFSQPVLSVYSLSDGTVRRTLSPPDQSPGWVALTVWKDSLVVATHRQAYRIANADAALEPLGQAHVFEGGRLRVHGPHLFFTRRGPLEVWCLQAQAAVATGWSWCRCLYEAPQLLPCLTTGFSRDAGDVDLVIEEEWDHFSQMESMNTKQRADFVNMIAFLGVPKDKPRVHKRCAVVPDPDQPSQWIRCQLPIGLAKLSAERAIGATVAAAPGTLWMCITDSRMSPCRALTVHLKRTTDNEMIAEWDGMLNDIAPSHVRCFSSSMDRETCLHLVHLVSEARVCLPPTLCRLLVSYCVATPCGEWEFSRTR